jgi:hypothetical protein
MQRIILLTLLIKDHQTIILTNCLKLINFNDCLDFRGNNKLKIRYLGYNFKLMSAWISFMIIVTISSSISFPFSLVARVGLPHMPVGE